VTSTAGMAIRGLHLSTSLLNLSRFVIEYSQALQHMAQKVLTLS